MIKFVLYIKHLIIMLIQTPTPETLVNVDTYFEQVLQYVNTQLVGEMTNDDDPSGLKLKFLPKWLLKYRDKLNAYYDKYGWKLYWTTYMVDMLMVKINDGLTKMLTIQFFKK